MTQILTVACKDCGKVFFGVKAISIDVESAKDIENYRDQGHKVDIQHKDNFSFGCECQPEG